WIRKNVMRDLKFAQKEKNFMQAITHELKTPISAIKINAQTLATRKVNDEQKNNLLSNIIQEANRQELLIENILLSTQFENKVQNNNFEQLNLGAIIDHTIIRFQTLHSNSEVQNNIPKSAEELNIKGIPDLLLIAFYNLVENAHKYSLANSERPKIDLNYRIQNQQICIEISDSGIGIAKEELENIFNKFYRIGDEKNRTTKGSGLGLYIVKSIVDLHYGQIEVIQRKPSGCTFAVKFKKA
ncbi:MAG: sensor histidine kinase, partial [Bacteroidota bacterium]